MCWPACCQLWQRWSIQPWSSFRGPRLPNIAPVHDGYGEPSIQIRRLWRLRNRRSHVLKNTSCDYGSCGKPTSAKIPVWSWGAISLSRRRVSAATPTAAVAFRAVVNALAACAARAGSPVATASPHRASARTCSATTMVSPRASWSSAAASAPLNALTASSAQCSSSRASASTSRMAALRPVRPPMLGEYGQRCHRIT